MLTGQPFEDLRTIIAQLPAADDCAARKYMEAATKAQHIGACGLTDIGAWLASWQAKAAPQLKDVHICLLASSYKDGGDADAVLAYIAATAKGRAPVNLLCVDKGIGLRALEMAPSLPHDVGADWAEADCMAAVAFGMEAAASGGDVLGIAALAPGLERHARRVIKAVRGDVSVGEDGEGVISCADNPLQALRLYGGREIAGSIGALIAARSRRLPVLAEGYAALAAMVVLDAVMPGACDHVKIAAPDDAEFEKISVALGYTPIVSHAVGVGPGCAVPVALTLFEASCLVPQMPDMA